MSETEPEIDLDRSPEPGHAEPEGPGNQLREARAAQQRSIDEVARQLNLEIRQVRALEANDYAQLPEPIFVAGYLKNYARLLGLPEDQVLAAYPHRTRREESLAPNIEYQQLTRTSSAYLGLVTTLIVLALLAAGVAWWWTNEGPGSEPAAPPPAEAPPPASDPAAPAGEPDGKASDDAAAAAESSALADAPAPPQQSPPPPAAEQPSTPEPAPAGPAPAEPQTPAAPQPTAVRDTAAPEPAAPAAAKAAPSGRNTLRLVFDKDSWTEVHDASGRTLVYTLVKGGHSLQLHGQPPFRVFLGYAPGVSIEYNGEPFDQSPYIRNNIARFRIGRSAGTGAR